MYFQQRGNQFPSAAAWPWRRIRSRPRGRCRPRLEGLEHRYTPAVTAAGASFGSLPVVQVLNENGAVVRSFLAYPRSYRGGVNVAVGDVTGDGVDDIITGNDHGRAVVKVFDGSTGELIRSFRPFGQTVRGGVDVAYGHFGRDGVADLVAGQAHGGSRVQVFDARTLALVRSWTAYGKASSGVQVAVADLDGGFWSDVITAPGPGGPPVIRAFDVATGRRAGEILADDPSYRGGVEIA